MLASKYDFLTSTRNRKFTSKERTRSEAGEPLVFTRRRVFSSKFFISLVITFAIIIAQIFLFHYYVELGKGSTSTGDKISAVIEGDWKCILFELNSIQELANRYEVDLIVTDPDLIQLLDSSLDGANDPRVSFSRSNKASQESSHKTILHLAIVNETSGGQPNLKLFHDALKNNGYTTLKYIDESKQMQPEVYSRASHLFDDMTHDDIVDHKFSHDSRDLHNLDVDGRYSQSYHANHDKVSKIYMEFMSHLFILNRTTIDKDDCKFGNSSHFVPIHIFILYNFSHEPASYWYQPGLVMDEMDKHKLLIYSVHSFDFKIPIDHPYIHRKRPIRDVLVKFSRGKKGTEERLRVFGSEKEHRILDYVNNTYIHCERSQFNISGLSENRKFLNNYLKTLDFANPLESGKTRNFLKEQVVLAFQFLDTFSQTYGNFSYWLTGSSLLTYHKNCDLILVLNRKSMDHDVGMINLEIGLFSSEVNSSLLEDLSRADAIGLTMLTDWHKTNGGLVAFQLKDCPNLIFYLYLYQLRKDFHQDYFIADNTLTLNNKLHKKTRSIPSINRKSIGHHVFSTNNLVLCWTQLEDLPLFRVPCNVHDHLRRIYVI